MAAALGPEGLQEEQRAVVAATCERRAKLELAGAASFVRVTGALIELRADVAIVELAARAIPEEMNHAEIYRSLATAYAGREVPRPQIAPTDWPPHPGAAKELVPVLDVVGMCAINETMACAFLEECLSAAQAPLVQSGLRDILADEIRHGRVGWAWLASAQLSGSDRAVVESFVLPLLQGQIRGLRAQLETVPAPAVPEHGCPSREAIERAMVASIENLVLPGFEHLGFDTRAAREWAGAGAPT